MFTVNRNPDVRELNKFGWAMLIGFPAISALLWVLPAYRIGAGALAWSGTGLQITAIGLLVLGIGLCLLAKLSPPIAKPVYVVWMSLTVPIGIVMSTIMLTVLFVVLLPVFSMIVRFQNPLRRKLAASKDSYWDDYKPYEPTLERMERPF